MSKTFLQLLGMQEKNPFLKGNELSQGVPDGHLLSDGTGIRGATGVGQGRHGGQLAASWEQRNVSEERLNFRTLSVSMDRLDLEMNPPEDR